MNRIRTMKAKSTLLRRLWSRLDRILIACVLGVLLFESLSMRIAQSQAPRATIKSESVIPPTGSLLVAAHDRAPVGSGESSGIMHVDRYEFARQIALSILVEHEHEISDQRVSFMRDNAEQGTAISQFADAFGRAIERGVTRFEMPTRATTASSSETVSRK